MIPRFAFFDGSFRICVYITTQSTDSTGFISLSTILIVLARVEAKLNVVIAEGPPTGMEGLPSSLVSLMLKPFVESLATEFAFLPITTRCMHCNNETTVSVLRCQL